MKKLFVFLLLVQGIVATGLSQESNDFKPNGKPLALIFTNFHTSFTESSTMPAFEITRAYLGYEYNFSRDWYAKVVFDVGDPGVGKHEMAAFLKNAYFKYSKSKFTAYFGMIATTQFKVSEKIWGYRYIEKSFQDAYGFNASADLGFNLEYEFADFISADFSVTNGEGYKKIQGDSILRPGAGITVNPVKTITARIYGDFMGNDVKQQSVATFLAYNGERLTVGAEYNYQWNVDMVDGQDMSGTSFYFSLKPCSKVKLFGRYDDLNSSTLTDLHQPWQIDDDGQLYMAGIEYSPTKGVKLAPNFRLWSPDNESFASISSAYLNCELKF